MATRVHDNHKPGSHHEVAAVLEFFQPFESSPYCLVVIHVSSYYESWDGVEFVDVRIHGKAKKERGDCTAHVNPNYHPERLHNVVGDLGPHLCQTGYIWR